MGAWIYLHRGCEASKPGTLDDASTLGPAILGEGCKQENVGFAPKPCEHGS